MGLFPTVTGWCEMASFLKSWHLSVESNTTHPQLSSGFTIHSMLDEFIEQPQSCCSPSVEDGDMQILGQEEVTQPGQRTWVNLRLSAPFSRHLYPDCPCISKHLTSKEKESQNVQRKAWPNEARDGDLWYRPHFVHTLVLVWWSYSRWQSPAKLRQH